VNSPLLLLQRRKKKHAVATTAAPPTTPMTMPAIVSVDNMGLVSESVEKLEDVMVD
jgi:hypothetical protein